MIGPSKMGRDAAWWSVFGLATAIWILVCI